MPKPTPIKKRRELKDALSEYYNYNQWQTPIPTIPQPKMEMEEQGLFPGLAKIGSAVNQFGENYVRPVRDVVNSIMAPTDPNTGMPNADIAGPVMTGLTGARNAQNILEQMQAMQKADPVNLAGQARRFLQLKYPTLVKALEKKGGGVKIDEPMPGSSSLGVFRLESDDATIFDRGANRPLPAYVNTGAHEVTHGIQKNRQGRLAELYPQGEEFTKFNPRTKQEETFIGKYIPSGVSAKEIKELKEMGVTPKGIQQFKEFRFNQYENQLVEREARQGGKTGKYAWQNFVRQVEPEDIRPFDVNAPITQKDLDEIYNAAIYKQYADIADKKGTPKKFKQNAGKLLMDRLELIKDINHPNNRPSGIDLNLTIDTLRDIVRKAGYTSILKGQEKIPISTIQDLLDINPFDRFVDPY